MSEKSKSETCDSDDGDKRGGSTGDVLHSQSSSEQRLKDSKPWGRWPT